MIDEGRVVKLAVDTGNVVLGVRQAKKAVKRKVARLVVVASNCPDTEISKTTVVKVHVFPGSNVELGAACGKPYAVSALAVIDPGESNILAL